MRGAGLAAVVWVQLVSSAAGQTATRELPNAYRSEQAVTILVTVDAPSAPTALAVEESPPVDWSVSDIGNGGAWDAQTGKVKWGPFFNPTLPLVLSYAATPPAGSSGAACFEGLASFAGEDVVVGGDPCIAAVVPAVSTWGLVVAAIALLCVGSVIAARPTASASRSRAAG